MSGSKNPTNMTPDDQLLSLCSGCRYIFKAMYTHETPLTLICKLDLANLVHLTEERNIKFSSSDLFQLLYHLTMIYLCNTEQFANALHSILTAF